MSKQTRRNKLKEKDREVERKKRKYKQLMQDREEQDF